ncbi:MAG: hypothetical protein JXB60_07955 [Candidatus Cloacimonetes bacterium]|nr:hypothetical protein [Candidatus Cloacimonadota bacterium]
MFRKSGAGILIILVLSVNLIYATKSLERIANEIGVLGETQFNEGKYLEAAQSFKEAIDKYNEAVQKDGIPQDIKKIDTWWFYTYQAYLNAEKYEDALVALEERIIIDPSNYDLVKDKSIILKSKLDRPLDAINALIKFDSQKRLFELEKKIGSYYADIEDHENALLWYNRAYELKQDSKLIKNIAFLNVKLGRNEEAIKAYEDFIRTEPKESVLIITYKNLGALYEELKNTRKAIENFEKANNIKFDDTVALLLVTKYYDTAQFDKAMEKINQLLARKPNNPDAIYYRALIKFENGDRTGAKTDFARLTNDNKYGKAARGYIQSIDSE